MSVRFYMDVHVPRAITEGLRLRGVDVLTAQDDRTIRLTDAQLLDRAAALDRVLFTRDVDLLVEATRRQRADRRFAGVVYAHHLQVAIGRCVYDLELIGRAADLPELAGRVE